MIEHLTVADLTEALLQDPAPPSDAVVHLCVPHLSYAPFVNRVVHEPSGDGPGVLVFEIDDGSEVAKAIANATEGTIYVIVENMPVVENGEYTVEEAICPKLGYFTDPIDAEQTVNELNRKYAVQHPDADDHEDRFGFIPLDPAN